MLWLQDIYEFCFILLMGYAESFVKMFLIGALLFIIQMNYLQLFQWQMLKALEQNGHQIRVFDLKVNQLEEYNRINACKVIPLISYIFLPLNFYGIYLQLITYSNFFLTLTLKLQSSTFSLKRMLRC